MIELHRTVNDPYSNRIAEKLENMVVAHRVRYYSSDQEAGFSLPSISEGGHLYSDSRKIEQFLRELESYMKVQRSFTSDSCQIDPETGEIC